MENLDCSKEINGILSNTIRRGSELRGVSIKKEDGGGQMETIFY